MFLVARTELSRRSFFKLILFQAFVGFPENVVAATTSLGMHGPVALVDAEG